MKNPERIKLIGYLLTNRASLEGLSRGEQVTKTLKDTGVVAHRTVIGDYLLEVGIPCANAKPKTLYPKYSDLAIAFRKLEGEFYALRDEVSELKAQLGINASS